MFSSTITVPTLPIPDDGICANATWHTNDITVAGGNGRGSGNNQLNEPFAVVVDRMG
ncbi:unnamed protein product, partial [Adineta ricciae]